MATHRAIDILCTNSPMVWWSRVRYSPMFLDTTKPQRLLPACWEPNAAIIRPGGSWNWALPSSAARRKDGVGPVYMSSITCKSISTHSKFTSWPRFELRKTLLKNTFLQCTIKIMTIYMATQISNALVQAPDHFKISAKHCFQFSHVIMFSFSRVCSFLVLEIGTHELKSNLSLQWVNFGQASSSYPFCQLWDVFPFWFWHLSQFHTAALVH